MNLHLNYSKEKWTEFLFFLILLSVISWFVLKTLNDGVLLFDDGFFPFNPKLSLLQNMSSWNNIFFPGGAYLGNFDYVPLILFIGFFRMLGFSYSNSEAAYLILNLFIGSLGVYLLSRYITVRYIFTKKIINMGPFFGSALASLYYIFNYQQMNYYGGEFYTGFILINFTPLLLYLIVVYLSSPVKFGFWNRYLGFLFLVSLIGSAGVNGMDSVGTDLVWFSVLVVMTILFTRFMTRNMTISKHFFKKCLAIISAIVFSLAWMAQSIYYGAKASLIYGETTYLSNGKPLLTYSGFSSALQNLYAIVTSGFYGLGGGGPGKIWYSPGQFMISHPSFIYFTVIPVILSFSYMVFLKIKWIERKNLIIIFILTIIFYLFASRFINLVSLAYSNNFLLAGLNFSMTFGYSIYAFTIITAISLAISMNILQAYMQKFNDGKQLRFIVRGETVRHPYFSKVLPGFATINSRIAGRKIKGSRRNSRVKVTTHWHKGKLYYYGTLFIVLLLVVLFVTPIVNNPLRNWQYENDPPITGVFKPDSSFLNVGNFLSANSPYNNVLCLPVTVSPFATMSNNSSFMIASPPFSSFRDGLGMNSDPGSVNNTFAYPIMKMIPDASITQFSNFLKLLGIKYVILNTAQYPTWVSSPTNEFAGGGPPWNYSGFFNYLNSSSGIKLVKTFGSYDIFEVLNTLPLVYLSSGVKSMNSSSFSPMNIFDLYAYGHLNAGNESVINSTSVNEHGYNSAQSISVLTSSFESIEKCQYKITLSNYSSGSSGYYEQAIILSNYSRFGINSNASNFYVKDNNGTDLYSWIQNKNASSITLWVRVPFGARALYLEVLPESMNLLSSTGYIGDANSSTDNINLVFSSFVTNYHYMGGTLFSNNYFGFGVVVKNVNAMNLTQYPYMQMMNQNGSWNPSWFFYSSTNSTSSYTATNFAGTTIPIKDFKYGYMYVYDHNSTSQNTVESTNGEIQKYVGNNGVLSTSFNVNGGRSINLTLSDAFQFDLPSSGMPSYNISSNGEKIYPMYINVTGDQKVRVNHTYTYQVSISQKGAPLNKTQLTTILRDAHVFIYNGTKAKYEIGNFYLGKYGEVDFNATFQSAGGYPVVFDSQISDQNIISGLFVQVYKALPSTPAFLFNITGPSTIVPDHTYTYTLSFRYPNGTLLNQQNSFSIYKNITIGVRNYNSSIFSVVNSTFLQGKVYVQIFFNRIGSYQFSIMSHFYSGSGPGEIHFHRISNTDYMATVHANSSAYLILNQAFSTGWVASSNGVVFQGHYEANGFANSWLLPKGNYTVEIRFVPQKTQNILDLITIIAISIFTLALVCDTAYKFSTRKRSQGRG